MTGPSAPLAGNTGVVAVDAKAKWRFLQKAPNGARFMALVCTVHISWEKCLIVLESRITHEIYADMGCSIGCRVKITRQLMNTYECDGIFSRVEFFKRREDELTGTIRNPKVSEWSFRYTCVKHSLGCLSSKIGLTIWFEYELSVIKNSKTVHNLFCFAAYNVWCVV